MSNDLIETFYSGEEARRYVASRTSTGSSSLTAKWRFEDSVVTQYLQNIDSGYTVVDAPVGTGRFFPMCKKFKGIVGLDYSSAMLVEAESARARSNHSNITLEQIDLINQVPNGQYDILLCCRLLNLLSLEDATAVLANVLPKINHGGLISIRDVESDYVGEPIIKNKIHMHDKQALQQCISNQGFTIVAEHVFETSGGKPGRYCFYEIVRL